MRDKIDLLIGAALSILVLIFYITDFVPLRILELKTYDWRAQLRTQKNIPPEVVLVTIDNESISKIGRWPWPRGIIAELISKINSAGPRAIGVNILFSEYEQNPGLEEIKRLRNDLSEEFSSKLLKIDRPGFARWIDRFEQIETKLDNDTKLFEAVDKVKDIVFPLYFTLGPGGPKANDETLLKLSSSCIEAAGVSAAVEASGMTPPVDRLIGENVRVGHVNILPDEDGIVRAEPLFIEHQGKIYPSFSLALVMKYLDISYDSLFITPTEIKAGKKLSVPLDERGYFLISYWGGYKSFPYYSAYDALYDKIAGELFKDKIVIIGNTATGIADFNVTPVAPAVPGIEIVANTISDLIHSNYIKRPDWAFLFELISIIILGIYVSVLLPGLKAKTGAVFSALFLVGILASGFYFFISSGMWLKISYPSLLVLAGYTIITSKKFLITERKKELVEADSIETNKMLGLSFQGQGMLDMAFEKFRKCPMDASIKDLLYNLSLDFERKRQFNKAVAVLQHIEQSDKNFKDIQEKIKSLKDASEGKVGGIGAKKTEGTVIIQGATQAPTLGRYEIIKELGKGAMGIVYLGKDPKINRTVAIKTLQFDSELDEAQLKTVKERFFREAESAGMLNHPNIITIFDAGEDYDISYIAMELLDGDDLKKNCSKENLLPVDRVLEIGIKTADALDFAHRQGVIHRDIKPANIMVLKDGTIKVTDFGIARVTSSSKTQTGTVLGTPSYMSPEQIAGKKVDGRSDIFSLGVTLFELLTGEKPFSGESIAQLLFQITQEKHPDPRKFRPELPESISLILDKALDKDPQKRYQTASELVNDLKKCRETLK